MFYYIPHYKNYVINFQHRVVSDRAQPKSIYMSSEYVMMQVVEQGLPSLANGAGLKIQSHRSSGVQIPSPAYF